MSDWKGKPYRTSKPDASGFSVVRGTKDKQTGFLRQIPCWFIVKGPAELNPISGKDHVFVDLDSASRHAYMQGWEYYWKEFETSAGIFEIRLTSLAEHGQWLASAWQNGKLVLPVPYPSKSLQDAKFTMLRRVDPKREHSDDELRSIAEQEWDERKQPEPHG